MASASSDSPSPWQAKLGQRITIEGIAENAKLGALLLIGDDESIWIDGLEAWPEDIRTKRVEVTGKVIERADLPVFIQREDEPIMQGIPMPPGTDLDRASRRFLLAEAQWKLAGAAH